MQIDSDCRQVSCYFDMRLFQEDTAGRFGLLLPQSLSGAVRKRKAEFLAGRYCASMALAQLDGKLAGMLEIGPNRVPLWPQGLVGSITHASAYACAVVAYRNKIRSVGIDSESWIEPGRMEGVSRHILTSREVYDDFEPLFESQLHYLTLVFSAKESLFKCLFPLVNTFFDFHAAAITPLPSGSRTGGQFRFELLKDLNAEFCAGYSGVGVYSNCADLVHTAIILQA